ncbi:MAG: hypothetical protein ACE5PV_05925 [Candidatus Poribacteria bacterium]
MSDVRDKFWIWGHEAGSHNTGWGLPKPSRMTPAEGALYLGVSNIIIVRYDDKPAPPFEQYALALSPLKRVVWSIVGAGGQTQSQEVELVRGLAERFPNICGVMMDDFFRGGDEIAVHTVDELQSIQGNLTVANRKLDLWVVLYDHQLSHPVGDHLAQCDVVTFWTWRSEMLSGLEENLERVESLAPSCRKVLGCYMWDYGNRKPMPVPLMERQCQTGLQWLRDGRIDGMIFLANCICDLELETVEWTKRWIQEVGDEPI